MIYDSVTKRSDDMYSAFALNDKNCFRMAKVMEMDGSNPIIRFYGETVNARKKYKRIDSYQPTVGDNVILARISRTYIILGKVV